MPLMIVCKEKKNKKKKPDRTFGTSFFPGINLSQKKVDLLTSQAIN